MILSEKRAVFLDRARLIAELFGELAHERMRAVLADGHRDQGCGLLERRERRTVALRGERLPERELGLEASGLRRRSGAKTIEACLRRRRRVLLVAQCRLHAAEPRIERPSNDDCRSIIDSPSALVIAASPSMPSP